MVLRANLTYNERRSEQRERAEAWLSEKWTEPHACPICKADSWAWEEPAQLETVGKVLYRTTPGHDVIPGDLPVWALICNECGFTHFFNAIVSGVIRPQDYASFESGEDE